VIKQQIVSVNVPTDDSLKSPIHVMFDQHRMEQDNHIRHNSSYGDQVHYHDTINITGNLQ